MSNSLLRLPYWLLSLAMFIFCSCKGQRERQELTRLVQEWQGREMLLPDNEHVTCTVSGKISVFGVELSGSYA